MSDKPNYVAGGFWIIASIAFIVYWTTHASPQILERNTLHEVHGTFKSAPVKDKGAKGSPGAKFELREYDAVFGIGSSLYAVLDPDLFSDSKPGDSVFFLVNTPLYEERLAQPYKSDFIRDFPTGSQIPFYDLTVHGRNYLAIEDYNKKVRKENPLLNVIYGAFLLVMLYQVYLFTRASKTAASTDFSKATSD